MSRTFSGIDGMKCPNCQEVIDIDLKESKVECPLCRTDLFVISYPVEEIVLSTTDERPGVSEENKKNQGGKRSERYMYGKFYHDTHEFRLELHELFDKWNGKEKWDLRNKVVALLCSWIGQKKIESELGIKIPLTSTTRTDPFLGQKIKNSSFLEIYEPCAICGEDRITNLCHILPNSRGGGTSEANIICLCPTHHHLFDHYRLSEEEWTKIDISKKDASAQEYGKKVRETFLRKHWDKKKTQE